MSEQDDYLTRGKVFKGYAKFIKKKWGKTGLEECNKAAGIEIDKVPEDRWISNDHQNMVLDWIANTHGEEAVHQAGIAIVAERGIVTYAARIAGFDRVLDQGVEEIRDSIRFGEVSIDRREEEVEIVLKDVSGTPNACPAWKGIFEGTLQITKTKGTVIETSCQHKGADACRFLIKLE